MHIFKRYYFYYGSKNLSTYYYFSIKYSMIYTWVVLLEEKLVLYRILKSKAPFRGFVKDVTRY